MRVDEENRHRRRGEVVRIHNANYSGVQHRKPKSATKRYSIIRMRVDAGAEWVEMGSCRALSCRGKKVRCEMQEDVRLLYNSGYG